MTFILNEESLAQMPEPFRAFFAEILARKPGENTPDELDDYQAYLKSKEWKRIRRRIRKRDKYTCFRCKGVSKKLDVHHRSYSEAVMKGEADDQLICLCRGCHHYVSFEKGRRRTLEEAEAALTAPYEPVEVPLESTEVRTKSGRLKHRAYNVMTPPHWKVMTLVEQASYHRRQCERFDAWRKDLAANPPKKRAKKSKNPQS